ncbi:unnamed protein product [Ranitomeya imitator]|uniref:Uncharacterized protein n=1 Tax=Ranitomeya imitator TaxID=111125 RepID=A0ABN9MQ17_9NEOB|nr:unnamed protein product [Ranitomeya imitator]
MPSVWSCRAEKEELLRRLTQEREELLARYETEREELSEEIAALQQRARDDGLLQAESEKQQVRMRGVRHRGTGPISQPLIISSYVSGFIPEGVRKSHSK